MSKVTKWTHESIQSVAGTYKCKSDFRKGDYNAYRAAQRKDIMDSLNYDVKKVETTSKKSRKKRAPMSQEMKDRISAKVKATCAARSEEQKQAFSDKVRKGISGLTQDQKLARNAKIKAAAAAKTPEEKKAIAAKISNSLKNKPTAEKAKIAARAKNTRNKNIAEMKTAIKEVIK